MILPTSYTYNFFKPETGFRRIRMFLTVRRLWEVTGASDNAAPSTHKLSHTPPGLSASPAQEDAMDRSIGQEEEGGISFLGGLIPEADISILAAPSQLQTLRATEVGRV